MLEAIAWASYVAACYTSRLRIRLGFQLAMQGKSAHMAHNRVQTRLGYVSSSFLSATTLVDVRRNVISEDT